MDSDVISGVAVDPTGVKVRVKCGDSTSNCSRDTRLPHFVTNDDNDDNYTGRRTLCGAADDNRRKTGLLVRWR